jgi:hypothetical protein
MAGLDPAIHVFVPTTKAWMPGTWVSQATPFLERLWPDMRAYNIAANFAIGIMP